MLQQKIYKSKYVWHFYQAAGRADSSSDHCVKYETTRSVESKTFSPEEKKIADINLWKDETASIHPARYSGGKRKQQQMLQNRSVKDINSHQSFRTSRSKNRIWPRSNGFRGVTNVHRQNWLHIHLFLFFIFVFNVWLSAFSIYKLTPYVM